MGKYMIGLQLLIIGMGTVLISLVLLSLFLKLTGSFFGPKKEKKSRASANSNNISSQSKSNDKKEVDIDDNGGDNMRAHKKKMAAISAAVYQFLDQDKNYRIISIKKSDSNWKS